MDMHIIWFVLLVVLFIGYIVLDGFDLGVGMMHFTAKTDKERRTILNSIGPVWDANEVWLVTAGGALFAAFPDVYATVFSGFYIAFMIFLLVIIGRAIAIEFRSKIESQSWKKVWDFIFNISSYLIVLLLGITFGNIVQGLQIGTDKEFAGTFLELLNPYSIMTAITAVIIIRLHGSIYLLTKTEDELFSRIISKIKLLWIASFVFYIGLTIWTITVKQDLLKNYNDHTFLYLIPCLSIIAIVLILTMLKLKKYFKAFIFSSLAISLSIITASVGMFPNLVPSKPNPENSLSIYNAAASDGTLHTMFIIACIGIPLVLIYKFIMFTAFRGKVDLDSSSY